MTTQPVVQLENVHFAYGPMTVLNGVNLLVPVGAFMSVIGPNGGGKTTLLKLILGLLKPQQGWIRLFGQAPEVTCTRVGYVPQHVHFDPKFPITVEDVVAMGRLRQAGGGRLGLEDHERVAAAIEEMDLAALRQRTLAELSGGQRQRVLIARALAADPELMLMDEPTASVDARSEKKLSEILISLNQRMAILVVSHDLGFVSSLVQKVICVNRQVSVHPTKEITGEIIQDVYQGEMHMVCHDQDRSGE